MKRARLAAVSLGLVLAAPLSEGLWRLLRPEVRERPGGLFHREVTLPDPHLLYRLRPGVTFNWRHANAYEKEDVWLHVGEEGRRVPDFDSGGNGRRLFVACLGDSSTLGYGVADTETYPYRLGEELARRRPEARVVVQNFGVHGYTSRQGRVLLERDVLPLRPDVVILAFGFNDAYLNATVEDSSYEMAPSERWAPLHGRLERWSLLYRDAWRSAHPLRNHEQLRPRVGRAAFLDNFAAMIAAARAAGARPVLLDLDVPNAYLREPLARLAQGLAVPRLCARELFEERAAAAGTLAVPQQLDGDASGRIRLRWRGLRDPVLLWFDLRDDERAVQSSSLRDDGQQGDEVAGDGVHTLVLPAAERDFDVELAVTTRARLQTNAEAVNHVLYRRLLLEPGQGFDGPVWDGDSWLAGIGEFLRVASQDCGHPNSGGQRLLAEQLARLVDAE